MSQPIPLTVEKQSGSGQRKHTINRVIQVGPVSLRILTIASLASLLLFYLAETTQSATQSYEVQALQEKKQELVEETERLDLEAQRLQSLGAVKQGLGERLDGDFEAADDAKAVQ